MAHKEPVAIGERVFDLPGAVHCALVVQGDRAILVDTGQDKDYGRDLRRACEQLGVRPVAIINTHAHADHFGGNAYLLRQFPELKVFAPELESSLMCAPVLEPIYLFHGARPLPELTSKWLQAEPSAVHATLEPGTLELEGVTFEVLDTSGHSHRQRALRIDDVLLAADAVFGKDVLAKYPLPFGQDIAGQLRSFEVVARADVRVALPGHGELTSDPAGLAALNVAAVERATAAVQAACTGGGLEDVLAGTCEALGIAMNDLARYHLNQCTVAAYLSYLRAEERVVLRLEHGRLRWFAVDA